MPIKMNLNKLTDKDFEKLKNNRSRLLESRDNLIRKIDFLIDDINSMHPSGKTLVNNFSNQLTHDFSGLLLLIEELRIER